MTVLVLTSRVRAAAAAEEEQGRGRLAREVDLWLCCPAVFEAYACDRLKRPRGFPGCVPFASKSSEVARRELPRP